MRSAAEQRKNAVADEVDAGERRTPLRRSELDAVGACVPELDDARRDLLGRAGDAEALDGARLARAERRVEVRDDVEVRLDGERARARAQSPSSSTTRDAADDEPSPRVVDPAAHDGEEVGFALPPSFTSSATVPAQRVVSRPPGADEERHARRDARIRQRRPWLEHEALARDAGLVAGEKRARRSRRPRAARRAAAASSIPSRSSQAPFAGPGMRGRPRPRPASRSVRRTRTDAA